MNKIKAIFVDSEGTLRDNNHHISLEVLKLIEALENSGIHIVITSGLPRFLVNKIKLQAHSSNYIIASNGADIYDLDNNQSIKAYYLDGTFVKNLWYEYQNEFNMILGMGNQEIATEGNEYNPHPIIIDENNINNNFYQCHISQKKLKSTDNVYEELTTLRRKLINYNYEKYIDKSLFTRLLNDSLSEKDMEILIRLKRFLELDSFKKQIMKYYGDIVSIANQSINFEKFNYEGEIPWFTINNKEATKGNGIQKMCEYLDISKENTIGIGNDFNDRTMIDKVGCFLCPSSSCEYILKRSDGIYHEKEGIAKVLRKVYEFNGKGYR